MTMRKIVNSILISIIPVFLMSCENLAPGNWYKDGGGRNTEWCRHTDSVQAIHQFDVPLPIESDSLEDVK